MMSAGILTVDVVSVLGGVVLIAMLLFMGAIVADMMRRVYKGRR